MTKHTPAPWLIQVGNDGVNYIHIVKHGETHPYKIIAIVGNESEEHKADEKLILASPELLEALKVALTMIDDLINHECEDIVKDAANRNAYNQVLEAHNKATI